MAPIAKVETSEPIYYLGLVTAQRHLWIDAQRFDYACLKEKSK